MNITTEERALDQLRERQEQEEERQRYWLRHVAERGGLPVMEDVADLRRVIDALVTILDKAAMAAATVGRAEGYDVAIPFTIEPENIAALALIVQEARLGMDEFREHVGQIESSLTRIEDVRRAQGPGDDA